MPISREINRQYIDALGALLAHDRQCCAYYHMHTNERVGPTYKKRRRRIFASSPCRRHIFQMMDSLDRFG